MPSDNIHNYIYFYNKAEVLDSLYNAIQSNNLPFIKQALKTFDPSCFYNNNLLHRTAQVGAIEIAEYLLSQGFEVNKADCRKYIGYTPLHYAALTDQGPIAIFLLEKGANINAIAYKGQKPFDIARQKGYVSFIDNVSIYLSYQSQQQEKEDGYLTDNETIEVLPKINISGEVDY
ncbi:MAG: putative ankyrin repeat-containing transcription regulator [Rickettsiaceae bacterium]|jgi:ankyrin repeat protein|nr:putative ankyrin repeat-containing transcription regulator [Rickettsiaceae bacterium]